MKGILIFLGVVLLCWSCEEDKLDLYKGEGSVYFCYPKVTSEVSNVYMDTTIFSFAMYNVQDTVVRLSVKALGDMVNHERRFKVQVESTTAIAGTNYDELQSEYILPKDSVYGEIPIHIYREGLSDTTVSIELRLVANEYFQQDLPRKIVDKDTMINKAIAKEIVAAGIKQVVVRSVIGCRSKHGVCQKCYGMGLARRELVSIGESVGIIAAQSIGEPGTQLTMRTIHSGGVAGVADITQGLPRVEEIFEARKPKGVAVITEIDGKVKISESKKKLEIIVTSSDDSRTYTIPFGSKLKVKDGDEVKAAQPLIEGSINPAEILAIKGPEGVYEYVISEIQKAYRSQGVDINDKHIEVIARQMLRKMRVDDGGDTDMFPGSLVDMYEFEDKNKEVVAEGKRPATGKRALLGITKASLATDSFLSAASFQETTRVLTEAAIKGKEDHLIGLKENVIIGKLIPAGTGMKRYQDVKIKVDGEDEETIAKKEYSMKDDDSSEQEAE